MQIKSIILAVSILFYLTNCNDAAVDTHAKDITSTAVQPQNPAPEISTGQKDMDNENIYVFITRTGDKYHSEYCGYIDKTIKVELTDAKENGYNPCTSCSPRNKKQKEDVHKHPPFALD